MDNTTSANISTAESIVSIKKFKVVLTAYKQTSYADDSFAAATRDNICTAMANVFKAADPECDITAELFAAMLLPLGTKDQVDAFDAFSTGHKKIIAIHSGLVHQYVGTNTVSMKKSKKV